MPGPDDGRMDDTGRQRSPKATGAAGAAESAGATRPADSGLTPRYVCVHGHFYQPPRENPWLEFIELQDSAYPFHDWNARITSECYERNGASRLLTGDGKIRAITNNYAHMSFNFGPTLLSWLESEAPDVYDAIIEADKQSRGRFNGHGSAMAQAYNHLILPLANSRDKYTQILWGIRDFEHRFGRTPEGMWLPETAVDLESLRLMARLGLKFSVLSPHQANRVRALGRGDGDWGDVSGARIDPTRPYVCFPDGPDGPTSIALFFYDGPISQAIAFENLLQRGENLEGRLLGAFTDGRDWPQIVHIATDGETYGHHFRDGDMALAFVLEQMEKSSHTDLINYGAYLEKHAPTLEVEIFENSSWSCIHGVERWRSNCGCNTGTHPGWNQEWRGPLRQTMDWLRDALIPLYESACLEYLKDPWAARDDYIDVVLDRSPDSLDGYLQKHATHALDERERSDALQLLELQRHSLLMFTSCGWFFDELSGIETVQVLQYAGRALQIASDLLKQDLETEFVQRMEAAKSNIPENKDGRVVYDRFVRPAVVDLTKVGAHYAISALFGEYGEANRIYAFEVKRTEDEQLAAGAARLELGRATIRSAVTLQSRDLSFAVLHLGDHNVSCKINPFETPGHAEAAQKARQAFGRGDLAETLRALDQGYDDQPTYSLRSLFRDQQRRVLGQITQAALAEAEAMYRAVYEHHMALMLFIASIGAPAPQAFRSAAEFVLNADVRRALEADAIDVEGVEAMLNATAQTGVVLDGPGLGLAFSGTLDRLAAQVAKRPGDAEALDRFADGMRLVPRLPFEVKLWGSQNRYYQVLTSTLRHLRHKAARGDAAAKTWVDTFLSLAATLGVEAPVQQDEQLHEAA